MLYLVAEHLRSMFDFLLAIMGSVAQESTNALAFNELTLVLNQLSSIFVQLSLRRGYNRAAFHLTVASSKGLYMIRSALIVFFGLILFIASAYGQTAREQAMIDRLTPVGSVCMAGDACAAAAVAAGPAGPRSAEEIYNGTCMACHLTGASNAPLFGNVEQWAPRIATGMDALYASVFNGIEIDGLLVMPVNGLCLDCSEDELKATVDYMVDAAQ